MVKLKEGGKKERNSSSSPGSGKNYSYRLANMGRARTYQLESKQLENLGGKFGQCPEMTLQLGHTTSDCFPCVYRTTSILLDPQGFVGSQWQRRSFHHAKL